jgi:hypothetical protein
LEIGVLQDKLVKLNNIYKRKKLAFDTAFTGVMAYAFLITLLEVLQSKTFLYDLQASFEAIWNGIYIGWTIIIS